MPALDKRTGRPARRTKEDILEKLKLEAFARRTGQEVGGVWLEPWKLPVESWRIPVPLLDHDPDLVHFETNTKASSNVETGAGEAARHITVAMMNGEEMELLVQPIETVRAFAARIALIKAVGKVKLMADHLPLPEDQLVLDCVPRASVVTALLQFGFMSPNRLDPLVQQQIRSTCKLHGAGPRFGPPLMDCESFWSAAFEKRTWEDFVQHIGVRNFQIKVFSFGLNPLNQTRYIRYDLRMGGEFSGTCSSVYAENEVNSTADLKGSLQRLQTVMQYKGKQPEKDPSAEQSRFLEGLQDAAFANGVEKYGPW